MKILIKLFLALFIGSLVFLSGMLFHANITYKEPTYILSEEKLFDLVQRWRYENNLQPYKKSDITCQVAEKRLVQVKKKFSHDGFEQTVKETVTNVQEKVDFGENLAEFFYPESEMLKQWLDSPKHRENLEAPYTSSCIRCDKLICVQIFSNL